ncbi:hybrid sensor histidine kinase/response regulator [Aquabacterium sp. A3]|uniref:ATP-binding response regulator n=1 Tax=Aquabacterium sp. A3 TaxID=3132829 RepID=UPI003119935D
MSLWRRSLQGLSPLEARIDLQMLQDGWRTSPSSLLGQFLALVALLWIVRDWPLPSWQWLWPSLMLLTLWTAVVRAVRHFRRFGITQSGYSHWRLALLGWHALQSLGWGMLAMALLDVASLEWRLTLVAAVIVYGYTLMLVTVHDWGAAFLGSIPLVLLAAFKLLWAQSPSATYLALVMLLSMTTCQVVSLSISRRLREGLLLRHENADLVLQLREEIDKVTQAKARAEQADQQKSEFFASASHDLRQPLHVLALLSNALRTWVEPQQGRPLLDKMQTALSSLSGMFDKMFDLARLDAQRLDYQPQAQALDAMWHRLDSEFSVLCADKGLRWSLEPTREWVLTDTHVLERILRNLLNNAVRYTEHGEVRLRARARGPWVMCQVWDTGLGIQPQHRHRIFEDYFQASNEGRLSSEGLGLGLAVVRRLSMLGPTPIKVLSRPGRGSVFSVRVPRLVPVASVPTPTPAPAPRPASPPGPTRSPMAPTAPMATAPTPPPGSAQTSQGVVVLVDDDPDVLEGTALVLKQHGWQVAAATTPDSAMDALVTLQAEGQMPEGDMPCALISDHRLGLDINGLDALRQLRYEFGEHLPAYLVTGELSGTLSAQAHHDRVVVLPKPIDVPDLLERLARIRHDLQHDEHLSH